AEPPDSWYLPEVTGRLHLPARLREPARIEVVVNLTPSDRRSASVRVLARNLGAIISSLRALARAHFGKAALNIQFLDLTRQGVTFRQEGVRSLDWTAMRDGLKQAEPGTIDVKALEDRRRKASFFTKEVGARLAGTRVLIVLSSPVEF